MTFLNVIFNSFSQKHQLNIVENSNFFPILSLFFWLKLTKITLKTVNSAQCHIVQNMTCFFKDTPSSTPTDFHRINLKGHSDEKMRWFLDSAT